MIARLALAEGGIAHERVFVDIHFRLSQQQPDYVRLNPGMTVPTLVLADRILDQSRDIAEYALGSTPDDETKAWLDLHCDCPIEELTFGRIVARNPLARIMIPKRLVAIPPPTPRACSQQSRSRGRLPGARRGLRPADQRLRALTPS